MISLYIMGIILGILTGLLFKNTLFRGNSIPFIMELPAYRMPSLKTMLLHMWEKAKDFIQRAFTIIFIATIVIWFLQNFDFTFHLVEDSANSMLAFLGSILVPVFVPLGFGDWRCSTALITGLTAKEAVVSTFAVLLKTGNETALNQALTTLFTPLTAFSFLTFTLLYMPCVAAFAAVRREIGTTLAIFSMSYQIVIAWVVSLLVFQVGRLFI